MVLKGHEEGEEGLGRDPESLQQVPFLEYPDEDDDIVIIINVDDHDIVIIINIDDHEEENCESMIQ